MLLVAKSARVLLLLTISQRINCCRGRREEEEVTDARRQLTVTHIRSKRSPLVVPRMFGTNVGVGGCGEETKRVEKGIHPPSPSCSIRLNIILPPL